MSLAEKLTAIREAGAKRHPPERRELMAKATRELRESGIVERAIKVGDTLPAFALENQHGATVRSEVLLASGPLVLTVFRGSW